MKSEAGLDGADQRREAARFAGDRPFPPGETQAAQRFAPIGAAFRKGHQRNGIAGAARCRRFAEPSHRLERDGGVGCVRRRTLVEGEIEPSVTEVLSKSRRKVSAHRQLCLGKA